MLTLRIDYLTTETSVW